MSGILDDRTWDLLQCFSCDERLSIRRAVAVVFRTEPPSLQRN